MAEERESRPIGGALLSASGYGRAQEDIDLDRPGAIDSERGRTAYSSAEKQNQQFEIREADLRERNAEAAESFGARTRFVDADATQERRFREEEHHQRLMLTTITNGYQAVVQAALAFAALGAATANQDASDSAVQAIAGAMDKILAVTPPPTGGGAA